MSAVEAYRPNVLVKTENLSREEWLEYRRLGIGGSDAAAILGISPWRTARDLYYDKLNVVTADDMDNWVALEVGNLLEPLVARIFAKKTGLKVYQWKKMFQHPDYPWMLADLDYLVDLPDGTRAILEIKTTNFNAKDKWWYDGKEIVPIYYESQGRHYMAVMGIDRVYYCCLYGNNEDNVIIRHIDRDMDYEQELIALEGMFWNEHVLAKNPPDYTEDGDLILKSLQRQLGVSDEQEPPMVLSLPQYAHIQRYLELQQQNSELARQAKQVSNEMDRIKGLLIDAMGNHPAAVYTGTDCSYSVTYNASHRASVPKEAIERMKEVEPDIYKRYVQISESRRFKIKKVMPDAA